ncbi:type II secretion system protein [Campylobacter geochelonis]|uniref:type II secretion system protein n=1 Tax=Campylobacter geochelonis TaxID=1780362 RepID=UPI00077084C5|nr:prepilin-type N-terminal cleavage/methylation domain-containing protein [Campylobacter geochelonis]CZE45965.1 N-terminal methylation domain-containing protein [Campylobacter geochelonis]CZE49783.1 N-terminal methylation domain-containing protein [Campylobacter geochelonis]
MKKGFTMIELIFVIVILGILAAVAIPRLAATRDDAEIAKAATNLSTVISDLGAYYTSQGDFAGDIKNMTNVSLSGTTTLAEAEGSTATVGIDAAGKNCLSLTVTRATDSAAKKIPAYMAIAEGTDKTASVCKKIWNDTSVQKLATGTFVPQKCKTTGTGATPTCLEWENDAEIQGVPLVGLSVVR